MGNRGIKREGQKREELGINRFREVLMGDPEGTTEDQKTGFLKISGMSVEQFARKCSLTRASVYYYIRDTRRPSLGTMVKVCGVLDIPLSEGLAFCTPREPGKTPK